MAELQQQLDSERAHRQQLQQQLLGSAGGPMVQEEASEVAPTMASQAAATTGINVSAGTGEEAALAVVPGHTNRDLADGRVGSLGM